MCGRMGRHSRRPLSPRALAGGDVRGKLHERPSRPPSARARTGGASVLIDQWGKIYISQYFGATYRRMDGRRARGVFGRVERSRVGGKGEGKRDFGYGVPLGERLLSEVSRLAPQLSKL